MQEILYNEYKAKQNYYTYEEIKSIFNCLKNICLGLTTYENIISNKEFIKDIFQIILVNGQFLDNFILSNKGDVNPIKIKDINFGKYLCFKNIKLKLDKEIPYLEVDLRSKNILGKTVKSHLIEEDITEENISKWTEESISNSVNITFNNNSYISFDTIKDYFRPGNYYTKHDLYTSSNNIFKYWIDEVGSYSTSTNSSRR